MSKNNRLIYLPLGGSGEIGMNMYVYGYGPEGRERFILVDVGVTFPDMDGTPGVDLIFPDPKWVTDRLDRLDGIFITHAHEDHIGAIGHLFHRLKAPIYARKFTAEIMRLKLQEYGVSEDVIKVMSPWPNQIDAGPFRVGFMPVSHSIPEASGLVIDSPVGRLVHTGDLKLDKSPGVGDPHDPGMMSDIAADGIYTLVCDSTNVFSPNAGRSEKTLKQPLKKLIQNAEGMVVATTFASNVARLRSLAEAGTAAGRSIVVLGRSMQRMLGAAEKTGVLGKFPKTIPVEDAQLVPRENLMLIVTGSQGERRAASAQLARGKFLGMEMKKGDTFLFSSKTIPGNEIPVTRIINDLAEKGVVVIDDSAEAYHVSGHANRPDLEELHKIFKPKTLIPMHGEYRHLREHSELAETKGIASHIVTNGMMMDLSGDKPVVAEHVDTGRVYLDGSEQIGAMDGIVRDRIRMAIRGLVAVSLSFDGDDYIEGATVLIHGLAETTGTDPVLDREIEDQVDNALMSAKKRDLKDDKTVEKLTEKTVKSVTSRYIGKKPEILVLINRFEEG